MFHLRNDRLCRQGWMESSMGVFARHLERSRLDPLSDRKAKAPAAKINLPLSLRARALPSGAVGMAGLVS